jgi:hypothetical protein
MVIIIKNAYRFDTIEVKNDFTYALTPCSLSRNINLLSYHDKHFVKNFFLCTYIIDLKAKIFTFYLGKHINEQDRDKTRKGSTMNNDSDNKTEQKARLLELVEKIPVFSDLSIDNRNKIFALCSKMVLDKGEILFDEGDKSSALFILLLGKLVVKVDNSAVAAIDPVTSIGEMGVFTGEPRSATIEAMEKSALLTLNKEDLDRFMEENPETGVKIMRRVIGILAGRVTTDNIRIREFQNYLLK